MDVSIDEPGDHSLAGKVDDLSALGNLNVATFTYGYNPLVFNNYYAISDWRAASSIE
jgi:hypothetical protein